MLLSFPFFRGRNKGGSVLCEVQVTELQSSEASIRMQVPASRIHILNTSALPRGAKKLLTSAMLHFSVNPPYHCSELN